ncbi:MAG: hypothetical protein GTO02_13665, partial [Candidatus Dadabacteria bacterium]|nr:hypothetical protein [Candidatus Dadabacteria bacterium]
MAIKYIVTGTGRCGTMFMSKLLTSAGIDCGHEVIFTNEGLEAAKQNLFLNKETVAESSYMAAPYLNDPILSEATIIHLVRQPMKVINSFVVAYCYFLSGQASCKKNPYQWTYAYPPGADPEFKFMRFIYSHIPDLCKKMSPVERAALYYIKWNQLIEKGCVGRDFIIHPIESDISNLTKFIGIE